MRTRWLYAVVLVALSLGLGLPACAALAPRIAQPATPALAAVQAPGLYEILPPRFSEDRAAGLLGDLSVIGRSQQQTATALAGGPGGNLVLFGRAKEKPMAVYNRNQGSLIWYPDLTLRGDLPPAEEARRMASDWVLKNNLAPADEGGAWQVEDVTTLTRLESGPGAKPQDVVRTVRFVRLLDGLKVRGEHSVLTVNVGPDGKIIGARRDFRPVKRSELVIPMRPREQLNAEMERKFTALLARLRERNPDYRAKLLHTELIYYEQGGRYLQPVLFGSVLIEGPEGIVGAKSLLVSALTQTPEPIQERTRPAQEVPRETKPRGETQERANEAVLGIELTGLTISRPAVTAMIVQTDIRYGMYVVRDDSWDWVDDAWDFHTNLDAGNSIYRAELDPSAKQTVMDQYYWNHIWLFRDGEGQPDYSQQFVRKVDFVIIEGHGAPYLITTRSNCCDVIYLNGIPGYGPHSSLKGRTDYVLWKSCHVIPAPPEDSNWGTTWWGMFKGMRGNYGFCTSMWIDDDISDDFGLSIGLGVPNLSAWFSAVDSCKWNHSDGLEYGSAVHPCGQDDQRVYDYGPLPNPDCLTIWWQHP